VEIVDLSMTNLVLLSYSNVLSVNSFCIEILMVQETS
jgi:hypothetical protein